jgi:hypothetical protein
MVEPHVRRDMDAVESRRSRRASAAACRCKSRHPLERSLSLRHIDLTLEWKDGVIAAGGLTVPKSKTAAGTGRHVPFTPRVCAVVTLWLARFPAAAPESYLFPRHAVSLAGGMRPHVYDVDLTKPMAEWKTAWRRALKLAGLRYRWHDLRRTFVTRLAENPRASEETIRSLAGHVSKRMLERYSHIRTEAKRAAIAHLAATSAEWEGLQDECSRPLNRFRWRIERSQLREFSNAP